MDLESISYAWGDILGAIHSKDEDPELFQRIFIGSIDDSGADTLNHSKNSHHRRSPKSARTPVCFLKEETPNIYLTPREAQCVAYVVKGYTNPQAAQALALSKRTIEFYIKNVRRKLNCRNKRELVQMVKDSDFPKAMGGILQEREC